MNILFLGPKHLKMEEFLKNDGNVIVWKEEKLQEKDLLNVEYVISYGYRHIIEANLIQKIKGRGINLHISFLPWNRGADPNFWSFAENTPKGVSIHYLAKELDMGEILVQRSVAYHAEDTLRTMYDRLKLCIEELFYEKWQWIKAGKICGRAQEKNTGSYHRSADKEKYRHFLINGWDTKVSEILGLTQSKG